MSLVGTPEYIAPEVIAEEGYTGSVDWWAFGVFMYEMVCGKTPFKGKDHMQTLENILDDDEKLVFPKNIHLSKECKDLIKHLLHRHVEKRLCDPALIKKHPFFKSIHWPLIRHMTPPIHVTPKKIEKEVYVNSADSDDDEVLLPPSSPRRSSASKPLKKALSSRENQLLFQHYNYRDHIVAHHDNGQ